MDQLSSAMMEIGKCLWDPFMKHTKYLICYNRYIKKLETQVQKLEEIRSEIQQNVDAACRQGESVRDNVQQWLANVDVVKSEFESMVARSANTKCWKGWCWNPVLCYGLGKEAAKKIVAVDELKSESNFERVSRPPPPPTVESLLPTSGFQALASTESPMTSVLNALQVEGIQIIGVYGMGGVGKTTMMKEVAKQAAREKLFDEVVMVTVSQNVMIEKIQKEIGEKLGLRLGEESASVSAARLLARLKQVGKLLLILDDLWERLDLNDVGIPCGDEHKGCKIIITTRSSAVCSVMRCQRKIEVKPLSEDDSWSLFQENAGPLVNSPDLSCVSRDVVRECKGLPLAIIVVGLALRDKNDVGVWNAVLKRLRLSIPAGIQGMEKQVFQSIQFSFDYLESEQAKLCFLFCCLFPEDYDIHFRDVIWIMVGERQLEFVETLEEVKGQVYLLLDNLKASGLLLEGNSEGLLKLHDIVRDVAIWIASGKTYGFYSRAGARLKEWPRSMKTEEYQRISLMDNEIHVLPDAPLSFPNLRSLILSNNWSLTKIPDGFFSEMRALEVLDLSQTRISSLPTSTSLLTNLRVLILRGCRSFQDFSGIVMLTRLEILDLSDLSSMCELPRDLGRLSNLRYLDLSDNRCRIPQHMISQLSSLEELYIDKFDAWLAQRDEYITCQAQGVVDMSWFLDRASFTELACLSRLRRLEIKVQDERCFSEDMALGAFDNLVHFRILPTTPMDLFKSRFPLGINLLTIFTPRVPTWAKLLLPKTKGLIIQHCSGMECLVGAGGGNITSDTFSNIEWLLLYMMKDLSEFCCGALPDGFLSRLRKLEVEECYKLIKIFTYDLMLQVNQLEELRVSGCLQLLHVFHNNSAERGCHIPMLLPQLKVLELDFLPRLVSIWEDDISLKSLRKLVVGGCHELTSLFSWKKVQSLEFLEELLVYKCPGLVAIIMSEEENSKGEASMLPWLRELILLDLKITSFDAEGALFDWPSLELIRIVNCPNLKRLPLSPNGGLKLRAIRGSKEWLHVLEWEDESIKSRLQTLFIKEDEEEEQEEEEEEEQEEEEEEEAEEEEEEEEEEAEEEEEEEEEE